MARKSRLDLRKEAEAAEAIEAEEAKAGVKKKKKAAKRKTTKRTKKVKAIVRKRLLWGVFSSSMKEEARFPYDQRKEADKKLQQLSSKNKRTYFIQPIKEAISEPVAAKE